MKSRNLWEENNAIDHENCIYNYITSRGIPTLARAYTLCPFRGGRGVGKYL
jgi:hypothetical protein